MGSASEKLPVEILEPIIRHSLSSNPSPISILLTSSLFNVLGTRCIYTNLHFHSAYQLHAFLRTYTDADYSPELALEKLMMDEGSPADVDDELRARPSACIIPHVPKSVEVSMVNDISTRVFYGLYHIFWRLLEHPVRNDPPVRRDESGRRMCLDTLRLRCYSHLHDSNLELISMALGLVNPRHFAWLGPDPPHHFSTAIVDPAVPYLMHSLQGFTHLQELKLTHIGLINLMNYTVPSSSTSAVRVPKLNALPAIPSLKRIYIGQATYVSAEMIASALLLAVNTPGFALEEIRLVDAYRESIWGKRLHRSHVEDAAIAVAEKSVADKDAHGSAGRQLESREDGDGLVDINAVRSVVQAKVVCQAKSGRINDRLAPCDLP